MQLAAGSTLSLTASYVCWSTGGYQMTPIAIAKGRLRRAFRFYGPAGARRSPRGTYWGVAAK